MPAKFSSERFVGRERELSHLAVALEAASEGRSPRLLVSGRGGVGVTRLVSEAIRRVGRLEQPFQVVRCTAVPARRRAAFAPIVDGLAPWLASLDDATLGAVVGPGAEPIARLLPTLASRLGSSISHARRDSIAPERRGAWIGEAIQGLLERAGEHRPILLVIEDLHHADAGTRNLATFLARVQRPARACLLLTYGRDRLTRGHPLQAQLATITGASEPPSQLELDVLAAISPVRTAYLTSITRPITSVPAIRWTTGDGRSLTRQPAWLSRSPPCAGARRHIRCGSRRVASAFPAPAICPNASRRCGLRAGSLPSCRG